MANVITDYNVGDILVFKKAHPCGGFEWKVIRYGVDCKLECAKCGRIVMLSRLDISSKIKKIIKKD